MKRDIETREDLEKLLKSFYAVATQDAKIGHHFTGLNLEAHLPTIVNFWEKVLFGKPVYFNNPLQIHQMLNEKSPLTLEHFRHWVEIFSLTIDELFSGKMAEAAKLRAKMIAHSLNQRINNNGILSGEV